jgi:hypothetical protein
MDIDERDEAFLRGLAGPRHWTEYDATRALALWEASGTSRASFAERYGLRPTRLAWWARRLEAWGDADVRSTAGRTPAESAFVELVSPATTSAAARVRVGPVEVELTTLDAAAARFVIKLARLSGEPSCS